MAGQEAVQLLEAACGQPARRLAAGVLHHAHDALDAELDVARARLGQPVGVDEQRVAREKLERKQVPLVVGNLGPATFGQDDNALTLVDAAGHRELPRADKLTLARALVAEIAARLATQTA